MQLSEKLAARKAKLGVIGLGYVGLPLSMEMAEAGVHVVGCPRVIEPCTFHADPTVLCGVADCLRSCLVVACVVRSFWFGMFISA